MVHYTISEVRNTGLAEAKYQFGGAREVLRKSTGLLGPFDIFRRLRSG